MDVILSTTVSSENKQVGKSKTVLKNIKVLAFDTTLAAPEANPKTPPRVATLEVTPVQAEILMAAVKEGVVTLSLHSIAKGEVEAPEIQPTAVPKTDKKIILMRGKEKSEIEFQEK